MAGNFSLPIGAIKKTPRGLVLTRKSNTFKGDPRKSFQLLARDIELLMRAGEENIATPEAQPHLHLHTEFDNIYKKYVPQLKEWLYNEGKDFHRRAREYFSKFDADVNPQPGEEAGARVSVGAFGIADDSFKT